MNINLTVLRTSATVLISAAVAMQTLYPSFTWIGIIVAAASAVGIHAIPAVSQAATATIPVITTEVKKMTEQAPELLNPVGTAGNVLMGVNPPIVTAQKTGVPAPVAEVAPEPAPVAVPEPVAEPVPGEAPTPPATAQKTAEPVPAVSVPQVSMTELKTLLSTAADALIQVANKLPA